MTNWCQRRLQPRVGDWLGPLVLVDIIMAARHTAGVGAADMPDPTMAADTVAEGKRAGAMLESGVSAGTDRA
jgi:hypothetical protein